MSDATLQLKDEQTVADRRVKPSGSALPTWWLVFIRELADLWIGGKALILTVIYSIVLGIMVYVLASSEELSLIPAKELVYELTKNAISVSLFICLIIGADSLSGERERIHNVWQTIEAEKPDLWNELKSRDIDAMIDELVEYTKVHFPDDQRRPLTAVCSPGAFRRTQYPSSLTSETRDSCRPRVCPCPRLYAVWQCSGNRGPDVPD